MSGAALAAHRDDIAGTSLRKLFVDDPTRAARLSFAVGDLHVDISKQRVTDRTVNLLLRAHHAAQVAERRDGMFAGEPINTTERRAVLRPRCRRPAARR